MNEGRLSAIKRAVLAEEAWEERGWAARSEPLAVVGMACRFPCGVDSPEALWRLLMEGGDLVTEVPPNRWPIDRLFDEDPAAVGKLSTRWGAFFDDVSGFDAAFFGITPIEAERMDPQQRFALEVSWEALERAGIDPESLRESASGVFFSSYHSDYAHLQYNRTESIGARTLTGALHSVLPNRISHALGLHGPSLSVDTACSSSLVATHLASQALRMRECDLAIVGGVNLMIAPEVTIALSKGGFMSPTGHCHAFSGAADGFVRGEGCAVLVLKRLTTAVRDGDRVWAVVRGSAVNHDGTSTTLSAPNGRAQAVLVRSALERSGVTPEEITFIEAHGTGTELGDPIETDALATVFSAESRNGEKCALGALKANIGHTEAAAGVAGIVKTVLCMIHRTLPGQIHCDEVSPHIRLEGTPFHVHTEPTGWNPESGRRIAGVSSFGVGGTNGHVILEETPPELLRENGVRSDRPIRIPLSARDPDALRAWAGRWRSLLDAMPDPEDGVSLRSSAVAMARRRSHHRPYRAVVSGADHEEIRDALLRLEEDTGPSAGSTESPDLCFVFTGQGVQFPGMALAAMGSEIPFRETLERIDALGRDLFGWSIVEEIGRPDSESRLDRTEIVQPCLFAIQVALFETLRTYGLRPRRVLGHSVGEIAAAWAAGLLDEETALRAVALRGAAMGATGPTGAMVSVRLSESDVATRIAEFGGSLEIAAVNAPEAVVVSGPRETIESWVERLEEGVHHRRLDVVYGFHSALMEPAVASLRGDCSELSMEPLSDRSDMPEFVSTVTGTLKSRYDEQDLEENVRRPVRFRDAVRCVLDDRIRHFVEIGPHPALGSAILDTAFERDEPVQVAFGLHREREALESIPDLVGTAYVWGVDVRWDAFHPGAAPHVSLPTYPWTHQRYWIPGIPVGSIPEEEAGDGRTVSSGPVLPGRSVPLGASGPVGSVVSYEVHLADPRLAPLREHRIRGASWLPGVMILEWFRTIAAQLPVEVDTHAVSAPCIQDVAVVRGVEFDRVERVRVCVDGGASEGFTLHLHAEDSGGGWSEAASARAGGALPAKDAVHRTGSAMSPPKSEPAPDSETVDRNCFEAALDSRGLEFGPAFRLLNSIRVTDSAGWAEIGDPTFSWDGTVHPAVLDACTQLCLAVADRSPRVGGRTLLPLGYARYECFDGDPGRGAPDKAWRAAVRSVRMSSESAVFDVDLIDAGGGIRARISGLQLRPSSLGTPSGRIDRWNETPLSDDRSSEVDGVWWVFGAASDPLRDAVIEQLSRNVDSAVPFDIPWDDGPVGTDPLSRLPEVNGVIVIAPDRASGEVSESGWASGSLSLIRAIGASAERDGEPPSVVVVTRGQQSVDIGMDGPPLPGSAVRAEVLGLLRALGREEPRISGTALDLPGWPTDFDSVSGRSREAGWIVGEALCPGPTREAAVRDGRRWVRASGIDTLAEIDPAPPTWGRRLQLSTPGSFDGLTVVPEAAPVEPGPGEVRVRIEAAGVNFRDVLTVLDAYPGEALLGHECAGRIDAVGDGVTNLAVGQSVCVFAPGGFGSYIVVSEKWVFPAPTGLDPVTSASVPIAFATAQYALHSIGSIGPDDTVLIHSAAGGVGLAAVRWAHDAGARVLATAGSESKREFLRGEGVSGVFDSRSPAFEQAVMESTAGRGVDLVLNSLTGELLRAGLRVVKSGGLFVELGKREILTDEEVTKVAPDRRYRAFDLRAVGEEDPELLHRTFDAVRAALESGRLAPLPVRAAPLDRAGDVFRTMAKAEHVGKLVLLPDSPSVELSESGWIVVSGGAGGVGRATVRWLSDRGARRIAVLGRSVPSTHDAGFESLDAEVRVLRCDVTDPDDVEHTLEALRAEGPPISGVVHAAGVLRDRLLSGIDETDYRDVCAPKIDGVRNLHAATRTDPLRFFWLYSAAGPLLNAAGMGSYAAANAFLDAFALHRRATGLPAVSVRWGPWADAGMAARMSSEQQDRWEREGLGFWNESAASRAFDELLVGAPPVCYLLRAATPERSRVGGPRHSDPSPEAASARDTLAALPAHRRAAHVRTRVSGEVSRVLGIDIADRHGTPFRDLGLDSLSAIELRNGLSRSFEVSLPATLAFDHPTVLRLSDHLMERIGLDPSDREIDSDPAGTVPDRESATDGRTFTEVDALSDADAEAALLRELEEVEGGRGSRGSS